MIDANGSTGTRGNCVIAYSRPPRRARTRPAVRGFGARSQYAPLYSRQVIEDTAAEKKRFPGNAKQNLVFCGLEQRNK